MSIKSCNYCFEEIMGEATVCKHCRSNLTSERKENSLSYLTTLVALVLSLITLISLIFTFGQSLFEEKIAKIEFDVIKTNKEQIFILIRNEGNVPAALVDGLLSNRLEGGGAMAFRIPIGEPILIDKGKYHIIPLLPYGGIPNLAHQEHSKYKCKASLKIAQLGVTQDYHGKDFPCFPSETMRSFLDEMKEISETKANKSLKQDK